MRSIIFVCLGNICRSPLAEAVAKRYAQEKGIELHIESAGTGDWHIGEPPCDNSIKVAQQRGLDISSYRGRQVNKQDFETFDVVVGLDDSNVANLKALGCKNPLKLGDYGFNGEDVPDPYFFDGFEGFDKVFDMIEVCVTQLLEHQLKSN